MNAGYPSFKTVHHTLTLDWEFRDEDLERSFWFQLGFPAGVTSDDGLGQNVFVDTSQSRYQHIDAGYRFLKTNWTVGNWHLRSGMAASLFYESRTITYLSGQTESKWDINPGLGPIVGIEFEVNPRVSLYGEYEAQFYLPYISFGQYSSTNETAQTFNCQYRPFTYADRMEVGVAWSFSENDRLSLGYRRSGRVGYGGRAPSLSMTDIVTNRLDWNGSFFVGYRWKLSLDE